MLLVLLVILLGTLAMLKEENVQAILVACPPLRHTIVVQFIAMVLLHLYIFAFGLYWEVARFLWVSLLWIATHSVLRGVAAGEEDPTFEV